MTFLATPIFVDDVTDLAAALDLAQRAADRGARLVEWRVDRLTEDERAAELVSRLVADSPLPSIVTCRPSWEGGGFEGEESVRLHLLASMFEAETPPKYIDVELRTWRERPEIRAAARAARGRGSDARPAPGVILSTHDFQGRPHDLLQRVEALASEPEATIGKVVWRARSLRDNLEAFDLLRDRARPTIVLTMGRFGLPSRVLAPKFGGFLTFATIEPEEATAPGQPTLDEMINRYGIARVGAATRVYGVVGWPVEHSRGPDVHNAGFAKVGHDGVYLPLPVPPEYEHLKATLIALTEHEGLDFGGASVTVPHKESLVELARDRGWTIDPTALRVGAANTLARSSDGGWEVSNTDVPAAIEAMATGWNGDETTLAGKRVAVLGAGGVARAVVEGLLARGARVVVFNRSYGRAEALARALQPKPIDERGTAAPGTLEAGHVENLGASRFDAIVNATPIGMTGGPAPEVSALEMLAAGPVEIPSETLVFDTVYTPARTPLIEQAEAAGARTVTGVDMFLRQAARQFERWTGTAAPTDTLRAALEAAG